jgi:hypothetical protein
MNTETVCCESMSITCFCVLFRNVKCDLKKTIQICLLQKLFEMIHFRDHAWSFHRQFFWSFNLTFWRITHAHSRLSSDVCLFSICRATSMMRRQAWRSISSNLMWNDSSNLTKATHQTWRKQLIKLDEKERHLIKLYESVISSNLRLSSHQIFGEERSSFYFLMSDLMQRHMIWRT